MDSNNRFPELYPIISIYFWLKHIKNYFNMNKILSF